jgi:hypothetical protein
MSHLVSHFPGPALLCQGSSVVGLCVFFVVSCCALPHVTTSASRSQKFSRRACRFIADDDRAAHRSAIFGFSQRRPGWHDSVRALESALSNISRILIDYVHGYTLQPDRRADATADVRDASAGLAPRCVGTLPTQLGLLNSLSILRIAGGFTGPLPQTIFQLTGLTELLFRDSPLINSIPTELGQLSKLTALQLGNMTVRGTIPNGLFGLTELAFLALIDTQYLEGTLSSEIAKLSNIRRLSLSNCRLAGSLPSQLWSLTSLETLQVSGTLIDGTLSDSIGLLTNLSLLEVASNRHLGGVLPSTLGALSRVTYLQLSGNGFFGALPTTLALLTHLTELTANMNRLTGGLPAIRSGAYCAIEAAGFFGWRSESNCLSSCANAPKCCGSNAVPICTAFNDDCRWRLPICNGTSQVSNANATTQRCEPCRTCAIGSDVWFSWVSVCTGVATFDLCAVDNSNAIPQVAMSIYNSNWCIPSVMYPNPTTDDPCVSNANRSTCGEIASNGVRSTFNVVRDEEYRIQVGFANVNATGVIEAPLTISCREVTATTTTTTTATTAATTMVPFVTTTTTTAINMPSLTTAPSFAASMSTSNHTTATSSTSPFIIIGALAAVILVTTALTSDAVLVSIKLTNCFFLRCRSLGANRLSALPSSFASLTALQALCVIALTSLSPIVSGALICSFGHRGLFDNALTSFPEAVKSMPALRYLHVWRFVYSIFLVFIGLFVFLFDRDLKDNQISGTIPTLISALSLLNNCESLPMRAT